MKKKTTLVLCLLLFVAITLTPVFATTGSVELAASAPTAEPGETVEFIVSLAGFGDSDTIGITFTVPDSLTVQSGQWLISGDIANYNAAKKQAAWTCSAGTDLSAKTDVFKLVCVMNEPEVGQQNLEAEVQVAVSVKPRGGRELANVDASASVSASKPATELSLDQQTLQLDLSGTLTQQLMAVVGPANTTEKLSWSSSDNTVATVSDTGLVTAVAEGTANIKVTVGTLEKICQVTVACGHTQKTEHIAATSTCLVQGNNLYYTCDTCGDAFKADGTTATTAEAEKLPVADHTGGAATCSQQALCQWCYEPYGTTLPHTFTEKIKDAAHLVAGSGADCQHAFRYYYGCADCTAISTEDIFDSEDYGNHQVSGLWTSENDTHYHKCTVSGCSYKEQEGTCSGGAATCQAKAVCETCNNAYGQLAQCRFTVENPAAERQYLPATCIQQAQYYYSCEMCGAAGTQTFFYGSLADHVFTEKVEDSAHLVAGSGEDCQHAFRYYYDCTNCTAISSTEIFDGTTFGSHKVSDQWATENERHFHKCTVSGCTYKEDEAACAGGTATCTEKAVCAYCQQQYGTTLPHTFTEKIKDAAHLVAGSGADCQHAFRYYYGCADCTAISTEDIFDSEDYGNHQVSGLWTSENDTHYHKCTVSGCSYKEQEGTCSGGAATCQAKAVCETCNNAYGQLAQCRFTVENSVEKHLYLKGTCIQKAQYYYSCEMCDASGTQTYETQVDSDNHVHTEIRNQLDASCYEGGYSGDTWCLDCLRMTKQGTALDPTGEHIPCEEWYCDDNDHWHTCTTQGCTSLVAKAAHSYQWKVDSPATEDSTGLKHEECVCGVKRSEGTVIDKLDHVHIGITHHKEVKATCVSTGSVEYWTCSSNKCAGKYYGDEACQLVLETVVVAVNKNNHADIRVVDKAAATCDKEGYSGDTMCTKCDILVKKGTVTPATGEHVGTGEYKNDEQKHWKLCACGEYVDEAAHTVELVNVKEATETETGYTGDEVCSVCGYVVSEGKEIPVVIPETEPGTNEPTLPTTNDDTSKGGKTSWIVPVIILAVAATGSMVIFAVTKKRRK